MVWLLVLLRPGERLRQVEKAVYAKLLYPFELGYAGQCGFWAVAPQMNRLTWRPALGLECRPDAVIIAGDEGIDGKLFGCQPGERRAGNDHSARASFRPQGLGQRFAQTESIGKHQPRAFRQRPLGRNFHLAPNPAVKPMGSDISRFCCRLPA